MTTNIAYIGLGSNLGQSHATLTAALLGLANHEAIDCLKVSRFFASKPVGPQDQPDYLNAVVKISTELQPLALLAAMFAIEKNHGRVRDPSKRWGARTLDLDLLLFAEQTIQHPQLQVPHPQLCHRAFVVLPLLDIDPDLCLPDGTKLADVKRCFSGEEGYFLNSVHTK